jgi:valyl-tRNA synthetase
VSRIQRVAGVEGVHLSAAARTPEVPQSAVGVGPGFEVRVPLAGVIDLGAELARVDKEVAKVDSDLAGIDRKLQNPAFVQKAPPEVVEKDRARAEELREKRSKLEAHRAMLSGSEPNPARRDTVETQNEQKPTQETPAAATQDAASQPAPTMMETAQKVGAAAVDMAQTAFDAVKSGIEAGVKRAKAARKPAKKAAKKKTAARKPAKKAAKKTAARKTAKKTAKKAAKKTARKPARKTAKKGRGRR